MIWRETAGSGTGLAFWEEGGGGAVSQESSHDCPQLDGWRTIPGLPCQLPARPTSSAAPAPMPPLAAPPPCCKNSCPAPTCSTSSLVQHHQNCHSQAVTLHLWVRWGGVAAPKEHPWLAGGTFCKHANLALCHPASNGGATLLPSASSWQCISNANFREAHAKERLD